MARVVGLTVDDNIPGFKTNEGTPVCEELTPIATVLGMFSALSTPSEADNARAAKGAKGKKKSPTAASGGSSFDNPPTSPTSPASPMSPLSPMTPWTLPSTIGDRSAMATELAAIVAKEGVFLLPKFLPGVELGARDRMNPTGRTGAMLVLSALAQKVGKVAEPYLIPCLPAVIDCMGDKVGPVREKAIEAGKSLIAIVSPYALSAVLPAMYAGLDSARPGTTKEGTLNLLLTLCKMEELGRYLPEIIPPVTGCMWDMVRSVKLAAIETMKAVCSMVGNSDLDPFLPVLVACLASPEKVPEAIYSLAATTFVQAVEPPALAMMVPLLLRGLKERKTPILRQCAVITDNMARLVKNPTDAEPFLDPLIPALQKLKEEISDNECSQVASRAVVTLLQVKAGVKEAVIPMSQEEIKKLIIAESTKAMPKTKWPVEAEKMWQYVAVICGELKAAHMFEKSQWLSLIQPYLSVCLTKEAIEVVAKALLVVFAEGEEDVGDEIDDDVGEDLCNCEFSLAYGNKILLNTAKMWLKRGKRYGLCGTNDCGKSTLMRSIANGQLEGFPPPEELKSIYLENDIQAEQADFPVIDFVCSDPEVSHISREKVSEMLESVGFTEKSLAKQSSPVGTLSGGWKMKLSLARAMLKQADILLLDEPTNHLDKFNVRWLENYLIALTNVTSIIVSHDAGMLDRVCTDIIHFENRKLKRYRGNLSEFVKRVPEAQSYYELATKKFSFKFPEPGFLDGVKSRSKVILRMENVGFTYPNTTRKILTGVSIYCSMQSRVAVLGVNGAGKSTMIKLLTGELIPDEGDVTKHPNMRVAYVAQHAFHHLEQHLEKTPNEYIQWRYQGGQDKEGLEKLACVLTPADELKMAEKRPTGVEGPKGEGMIKRVIMKLLGRRAMKKTYEYEIQWVAMPASENIYMNRIKLEEWGWGKACQAIDDREAAMAGMLIRPLTQKFIQEHLEGVGLEGEYSVHTQMRALSGGQKVKVVIGAAMWNNPHVLVLDEPTNYLDRDSLGALAGAIKDFLGGVLMISHHAEFTEALCTETWLVEAGKLHALNQPSEYGNENALEWKMAEDQIDASGNTVKVKQPKAELSRKERIAQEKRRKERRDNGLDSQSDSD